MNLQVLIVEPDELAANALRRGLRSLGHHWDLAFVADGAAAIDHIDRHDVAVVVTPDRLPGDSDGVDVLAHARLRRPAASRILTSDCTDGIAARRASEVAHRGIERPATACAVGAAVVAADHLRRVHRSCRAHEITGRAMSLPSPASTSAELLSAIEEGEVRMVGALIGVDPGLSATILRIVNSPFFGIRRRVVDGTEATMLMGLDTLRALVLGEAINRNFASDDPVVCDAIRNVQLRGERAALIARRLARTAGLDRAVVAAAYTIGLLHDVGALVLASYAPEELTTSDGESVLVRRDIDSMGCTVGQLGALQLARWDLPSVIVSGIAAHEDGTVLCEVSDEVLVAHLACRVADGSTTDVDADETARAALERAGLSTAFSSVRQEAADIA